MELNLAKNWWKILISLLVIILVLAGGFASKKGFISFPGKAIKPVAAPKAEGKIKGYWSSEGPMAFDELDEAEEMKRIGINTITFSPVLSHNQEGKVKEFVGTETYVKRTINKAHQAGLRVMLETTPINAGAVNPKVKNPELFTKEMTRIALKYAKIAQDYQVEYFAPIVEPGHHMDIAGADKWLQELLPKLRQVYSGKIMWKKQSNDLEYAKPWNEDHIFNLGFQMEGTEARIMLKQTAEHQITLSLGSNQVNLEEYTKDSSKFRESKDYSVSGGWHNLKIEIKGNLITILIDDEKLIEKQDDSGPMGGYLLGGAMRINKLEITDLAGQPLYEEKFNDLNSFSAKSGIGLVGNELVISQGAEAKLIHDINFSGYDYIAIDTYHRGKVQTIDEYIEGLKYYIQKTQTQAASDGVPSIIIAEFGGSLKENIGWKDADERAKIPLTEEELAQTTQKVLELAEKEKLDGYIYNGWNIEKQGINKLPKIKEVIEKWYTSHNVL